MTAPTISAYVGGLRRQLPGPRGPRTELLDELAGGLRDAADSLQAKGFEPAEAERRAVEQAGDPGTLVPEYRAVLAAAQGRRTALLFAASCALSQVAWDLIWRAPGPWSGRAPTELSHLCWRALDAVNVAAVVLAIVALGCLVRRARGPHREYRDLRESRDRGEPHEHREAAGDTRGILALQGILGMIVVLTTVGFAVTGMALSGRLGMTIGVSMPVSALGIGSVAMLIWQFVWAYRSLRIGQGVRPDGPRGSKLAE